jgi:hypothetical protein
MLMTRAAAIEWISKQVHLKIHQKLFSAWIFAQFCEPYHLSHNMTKVFNYLNTNLIRIFGEQGIQ